MGMPLGGEQTESLVLSFSSVAGAGAVSVEGRGRYCEGSPCPQGVKKNTQIEKREILYKESF